MKKFVTLDTDPFTRLRDAAQTAHDDSAQASVPTHDGENCKLCVSGPDIAFSMAFQPIIKASTGALFAYEALARGPAGEPASTVLDKTLQKNKYSMDQLCREKAIQVASRLGILATDADLSINFFPNAVYEPRQCLRRTLNAAEAAGFPLERIIFEITEVEEVRSQEHLRNIMCEYQKMGLRVAMDDFGAGHSGLSLLSVFQPDIIKIDRAMIAHIDERPASLAIVRSIVRICDDLNIQIIGEGIEREQEVRVLCDLGIDLMQGFFFALPAFEALPLWSPRL